MYSVRLQHPERVYLALGPSSSRWCDRAFPQDFGSEVQLRQDDLPQVLRPPPPQGHQLQKEEVRSHLKPQAQEEAEVNCTLGLLGRKCVCLPAPLRYGLICFNDDSRIQ